MSLRLSTMICYSCSTLDSYISVCVINTYEFDTQISTIVNINCLYLFILSIRHLVSQIDQYEASTVLYVSLDQWGSSAHLDGLLKVYYTICVGDMHCCYGRLAPLLPQTLNIVLTYNTRTQGCIFLYLIALLLSGNVATVSGTSGKVLCSSCFWAMIRPSRLLRNIHLLYVLQYASLR